MAADPITIGGAVKWVGGAWSFIAGSGPQLSREQRSTLARAGYRMQGGRIYRAPDGSAVSPSAVWSDYLLRAASTPPLVPAPAPIPRPPLPTGGEIFEDLLRKRDYVPRGPPTEFERILNRPVTRPPSEFEELIRRQPGFRPSGGVVAGTLARIGGILAGVLYPTPIGDSDLGYKTGRQPPKEPPAPRGQRTRGRKRRPRIRPELPEPFSRPDTLPAPEPQPPRTPQPIPEFRPTLLPQSGTIARPVSSPRAQPTTEPRATPRPQPRVSPTPTASPRAPARTVPSIADPLLLLPLLQPRDVARPDRLSRTPPGETIELSNPIPLTDRQPLTAPQPQPLAFRQPPPSDPCRCTATRKPRKPRKPRAVCYRGTFTETRSSTLKQRKEKIPCQ